MLQATFCPFAVSSIPLTRSGAVSNRTRILSREGFVERILYRRALLRGQVERAAHQRGVGRRLKGLGEARFRLAVHLPQAAREHLGQAFFQTRCGEIRQRLARDGKYFLPGPAADSFT